MLSRANRLFAGVCLVVTGLGGVGMARAQNAPGESGPPKVLVATVEELKPGKAGAEHEKIESEFVRASRNAKSTQYYLAMTSMSGPSRAVFLFGYDSFADWQKGDAETFGNTPLASTLDPLFVQDGELLKDVLTGAFRIRPELNHGAPVNVVHMRYFDVGRFKIRPGHQQQWFEAVKQWGAAMDKLDTGMSWVGYEQMLGTDSSGTYLSFTPLKSLHELDRIFGNIDKLPDDDASRKMGEVFAAAAESSQHNLYKFSPAMSYAPPSWLKEDPEFWQVKSGK